MMAPIENNDTFLLFFHGLDSSDQTSKFTCIEREPKFCPNVDYRQNFTQIFADYDALIQQKLREYPKVVLAGHSLGAWFANHFAHKYQLRVLLIAPCINPSLALIGKIPDIDSMTLPFLTNNPSKVHVMVEVDDERLDVNVAKNTLVNLPKSWDVHYYEGGHHRIARDDEIWYFLMYLCDDPLVWVDSAVFYGEDD